MMNRSKRKSLNIVLTLALVVNLFLPFISQEVKAATVATDLFISEYVEGSSNNKAIELYNGTGQAVNLKDYVVELYTNGNIAAGSTLNFSTLTDATLENGKTFVIANSSAGEALKAKAQLLHAVTNFNGDDALVLKHNGTVIDSIGKIGERPVPAWGTTVKTIDQTLIRKSSVITGDTNTADAFDPAVEWDSNPIDYFDNLGTHTMDGSSEAPTKVSAVTASVKTTSVKAGTKVELLTTTEGATIYYTVDGSEPTTSSDVYSTPITINENTTIKAFAVADNLENSDVATFAYTVLQHKTISEVRSLQPGDYALTSGVVTAVIGKNIYIQDDNAGIVLYGSASVQPGDEVEASGKVADYNSLLELEVNPEDVQVLGKTEVPAAKEVTAAELSEQYEAMLVKVGKSKVESFSGGNYTAVDASGSYQVRPGSQDWLEVGTNYDSITGVLGAYRDVYQLIPRTESDIVLDPSFVRPVEATPGAGFVQEGQAVTLSSDTEGATIHYTTDGSEPTTSSPMYSTPITVNADMTIKAFAEKEGLTSSKVYTYDYIIQKDEIRIHDIQGAGHFSKYEGLTVNNVEGIVTYVVDKNNFYMQDLTGDGNDKTSEGILVYKSAHGFTPGDVVKVTGQVKEFYIEGYDDRFEVDLPSTEINATTAVKDRTEALPAPVVIGKDRTAPTEVIDNDQLKDFNPAEDAIDFYESLEGMYVQVDDAKIVAPQDYGEVVVIPGTMETNTSAGGLRITEGDYNPERITIDMNDDKFVAKMGDKFNGSIKGVMSYGYSNYRIFTKKADLPPLIEGTNAREITSIVPADGKLTVASYNVENFSPKVDPAKVQKLAQAIVTNLNKPDILGLTEVQDNDGPTDSGTTDASESAALLIKTIKDLGGPTYKFVDIAPNDKQDGGQPGGNIRVGFLYNVDRGIELMEAPKGTADQAVGFENGKLTLNPGRIDPTNPAYKSSRKSLAAQFKFQGKSVIVIANHFNSKGGDQPLFGKNQPPVLKSEVQRMELAKIVNGFVKDVKAKDPNANIILLGDFNDFEFSNPLKTLKGDVLTNMVEKVPADQRYSYSYQGNAQVLDHILVSKNMESATTVNMVHINSGFMEEHGRASDHDPLMIQTDLKAIEKVYNKVYNLTGFKTKKLVVGTTNSLINIDSTSVISEGIWLKKSATVKGAGLEKTLVVISAAQSGTVIDLSGAKTKEVFIDNANVTEIHGAENVQEWNVKAGVDTSAIKFYDSQGNLIESPFKVAAAS